MPSATKSVSEPASRDFTDHDWATGSGGNLKLRKIVSLLEEASRLAGEWADEHGPLNECDCDFCRYHAELPESAECLGVLVEDMAGVRWQAGLTANLLAEMIVEPIGPAAR